MNKHSFQSFLGYGICFTLISTLGNPGLALPQNGTITKGDTVNGKIDYNGKVLTIKTNNRSVIEWGSFSINSGETVDFQNKGAVLNYVTPGGGVSQISGLLKALDTIILINNQGINVNNGASINVPNLLLSTGTISNADLDLFIQGANAQGTNVPLINIELKNNSGPININGSIQSITSGDIGLISPTIDLGPNVKINTTGLRSPATGTDGVNVTVNGVPAEGTLWIGTTGLPQTPETKAPGLPTGFGYLNVSGRPNTQDLTISLQGQYDLERFVVGSSGALPNEYDQLFFSPNFRAADFFVYDGIKAISVGERESTQNGPLERKLRHLINSQWVKDPAQLESDILHMSLPTGVDLVNLSNLKYDSQGNPIGGSIQLRVNKDSLGTDFAKHFGQDAIISIDYSNNGAASVVSNNGSTGQYNPKTGIISWTSLQQGTATVAGPTQQSTTTQKATATITTPGATHTHTQTQTSYITETTTIQQGRKPDGLTGGGTTERVTVNRWFQDRGNSKPCSNPGRCFAGSKNFDIPTWRGDFKVVNGRQIFVPSPSGNQKVFRINGQYFIISARTTIQSLIKPNTNRSQTTLSNNEVTRPNPLTLTYQREVQRQITTTTTDPSTTTTVDAGTLQTTTFTPTSQTITTETKQSYYQPLSLHFSQTPSLHKQVGSHYHLTTSTKPKQKVPINPDPNNTKTPDPNPNKNKYVTPPDPKPYVTPPDPKPTVIQAPPLKNQPPGNQTPGNQTPGNQPPGNQTPGNQTPGNQPPGNQTPGNQPPLNDSDSRKSTNKIIVPTTDKQNSYGYEYQIPQDVLQQFSEGVDLLESTLQLPGGDSLPEGVNYDPFSETITISPNAGVNLPFDVELLAPTPKGIQSIPLTIGQP